MKRIEPESESTFRVSGMIKASLKDYYGCIIDMARFVKSDSLDVNSWVIKAHCHASIGDYENSLKDLNKCIPLDSMNKERYMIIYEQNLIIKDSLKALNVLRKMAYKWPNEHDLNLGLADLLLKLHDYDSAELMLKKVFDGLYKNPANPKFSITYAIDRSNSLFVSSQLAMKKGHYEESLSSINKSMMLLPGDEKLYFRMKLHLKFGKTNAAMRDLKRLQGQNYKPAETYYKQYLTKRNNQE